MIVCSCNVVSDAKIKAALNQGEGKLSPRTPSAVYKCLGCSPRCGRCFVTVRKIIDESLGAQAHQHGHAPAGGSASDEAAAAPSFDMASCLAGA